jgi:hypothetical protein
MSSLLIEIAKRRQQAGSGSQPVRLHRPVFSMFQDIFSVPYAIAGGQATKHYMPERMTLDWDVIVAAHDEAQARLDLERSGAGSFSALSIPGFSCILADRTQVDVITENAGWLPLALDLARRHAAPDSDPVLPLPYLGLLKLRAGRVQDLADVSRMMSYADESARNATRDVIGLHLPDAVEDLESLIELGKLENPG